MKNISEAIQKLQDTETNLGEDHVHTEEASDRIHNQGNVELVELRQTSKTDQCEDCLKHIPEEIVRCYCGYMIRPTREFFQRSWRKTRRLCQPQWKVRLHSRGMKHGHHPWQEMHRRAKDHLKGATKHGRKRPEEWTTIFLKDGTMMMYIETINQNCMEKYLDYFAEIEKSYTATRTQRNRSECRLKVFCNYPDHNGWPGSGDGDDYKQKRVGSARFTGRRKGTHVRWARPENQGTLDMVEEELGEVFLKRPRTRHLHRLGQDLLRGGIHHWVIDTGKNGKNNPGRNKNGMSENEIRWSFTASGNGQRPSEIVNASASLIQFCSEYIFSISRLDGQPLKTRRGEWTAHRTRRAQHAHFSRVCVTLHSCTLLMAQVLCTK